MRYDAYLLDLYGTLVDIRTDETALVLWEMLARFYAEHRAKWTGAALQRAFEAETEKQLHRNGAAYPEIDLAPVFAALYRCYGVQTDDCLLAETAWRFRMASTKRLRLYAGAKELLCALRKQGKVILLSNAQRLFTMPELRMLGLADAFDAIYLSSDYGCKKPDPAFFRLPVDQFGLDPKRCLMIGNDPACDIAGAHAMGMDAYYIRSAISPKGAPSRIDAAFSQPRMDLVRVRVRLCGE